jgi:hypothetical protein
MECERTAKADTDKLALPEVSVAVPIVPVPSLNVIFPVGITPVAELTCALNTTVWLYCDGFGAEVNVVVLAAGLIVCTNTGEALATKVASPLYTAVME